jgi:hypothetical protein
MLQAGFIENIKIHILYSTSFSESRAVYYTKGENTVQLDRSNMQ